MEAAGIEPASRKTQWETLQRLTETDDPLAAHLQLCDSTGCHSLSPGALELAEVINAWPNLPAAPPAAGAGPAPGHTRPRQPQDTRRV